jgi:hypothetical protein
MSGSPQTQQPQPTVNAFYTTRIVYDGSGNPIYIGKAPTGTTELSQAWQIQKLTWVSGNCTQKDWASGTDKFDKIWNDGATTSYLSYSYS